MGAEEICRLNLTHPIGKFGAFWMDFWIIESVHIFLHRIRLKDSFSQNIINFHKIGAEYGPPKGFGARTIFFGPIRGDKS